MFPMDFRGGLFGTDFPPLLPPPDINVVVDVATLLQLLAAVNESLDDKKPRNANKLCVESTDTGADDSLPLVVVADASIM